MTDTPTRSPDSSTYDDVDPITAVLRAWTEPWPNMEWREICMQDVRETNPALAAALDRLVKMSYSSKTILEHLGRPPANPSIQAESPPDVSPAVEPEPAEADVEVTAPADDDLRPSLVTLPEPDAAEFDPAGKTVEEIGVRAQEASLRLQAWGRRGTYREAADRESELRTALIVNLYNRDSITQQQIADMVGVSPWRITQILNAHYERLRESVRQGRKIS